MPKSTCAFAFERASAKAGGAAQTRSAATVAARARSRARIFMGVPTTIVTRFKHRKLFRWLQHQAASVQTEQWPYHEFCGGNRRRIAETLAFSVSRRRAS